MGRRRAPAKMRLDDPPQFAAFWAAYPRHVHRRAAVKAWQELNPSETTVAAILAALLWQCPLWDDDRYIPHPASWLRGERWTDERPSRVRTSVTPPALRPADVPVVEHPLVVAIGQKMTTHARLTWLKGVTATTDAAGRTQVVFPTQDALDWVMKHHATAVWAALQETACVADFMVRR